MRRKVCWEEGTEINSPKGSRTMAHLGELKAAGMAQRQWIWRENQELRYVGLCK